MSSFSLSLQDGETGPAIWAVLSARRGRGRGERWFCSLRRGRGKGRGWFCPLWRGRGRQARRRGRLCPRGASEGSRPGVGSLSARRGREQAGRAAGDFVRDDASGGKQARRRAVLSVTVRAGSGRPGAGIFVRGDAPGMGRPGMGGFVCDARLRETGATWAALSVMACRGQAGQTAGGFVREARPGSGKPGGATSLGSGRRGVGGFVCDARLRETGAAWAALSAWRAEVRQARRWAVLSARRVRGQAGPAARPVWGQAGLAARGSVAAACPCGGFLPAGAPRSCLGRQNAVYYTRWIYPKGATVS